MAAKYPSIPQDSGEDTDEGSSSSVYSVRSSAEDNTTVPSANTTSGTTPDNDATAANHSNDTAGTYDDEGKHKNPDNLVTAFKDLKLSDKAKISDKEWEEMKSMPAVQSCLEIFTEESKVKAALKCMKMKHQGKLPADITGQILAGIIIEIEENEDSKGHKTSAILHIFDQGHQDDGTHEIHLVYKCKECDKQGIKPEVIFQK